MPIRDKTLRLGVIVPSTNVVVEDEFNQMRAPGVSFHTGRILIENEGLADDDQFEQFLELLRTEIAVAVRGVTTCRPDYVLMGMSAETFWGGVDGAERFQDWIEQQAGLRVTTGAKACKAALDAVGARRIGVITPYQPVGDGQVRDFFTQIGFDVAAVEGLKCKTATAIADVTPDEIRAAFLRVDDPSVEALVQAGTNLQAVDVAAELEQEIGKPVIAINAATVWHGYRTVGVDDRLSGFGSLLEEH